MNSLRETFELAVKYHQGGNLRQADLLCRQILQLDPRHAEALHLLGVIAHQVGRYDLAVEYMQQAARLQPAFPEALNNLGTALAALGRIEEAVANFQQALRLKADSAEMYTNLAGALREGGKLEEAIANYRQAIRLKPDYVRAFNNLGNVLADQENFEEAITNYQQVLRLKPDFAAAHGNLGNALQSLGKFAEAIASYQEALRLNPNFAEGYNNLGTALAEQHRLDEAVASYGQALRLQPNYVVAHRNLGNVLLEQGRLEEARLCYQQALRLKPNFAEAFNDLGRLHEALGELAQAESAYRKSLRLQPTYAPPYARLVAMLRGKLPDADRAALVARLADPQLGVVPRSCLLFALAHVLDAHGDFQRAGETLREANALSLEWNRARQREYSPARHERFVDGLLQAFGPAFVKRTADIGAPTRRPVFVFGLPRSGTTLIEQVLASHSLVHGAGELRLTKHSFEAIPKVVGQSDAPMACVPHLERGAILRLAQLHDDRLRVVGGEAERVVDKMCDNYMYLGLLAALFPRAVFIHCRRDLRDVAVSCWMTDFGRIRWANDPEHIASRFRQYRRLMDHWHAVLPVPIHEVNYEDVVANLEGEARRLLAACGLDWEPSCLEFHRTRRPIHTISVAQVRQPIYQQSVARWRNYQNELASLFALLPAE